MDALVMCGGRGTRLDGDVEKPLYPIRGEAMIDRVRRALTGSAVETTYAVVSPNAPDTRAYLRATVDADGAGGPELVETAGEGYVTDLAAAIERPAIDPPVLTVAADLPLLHSTAIDRVLRAYAERTSGRTDPVAPSMTVAVPASVKRRLGVRVESTLPERPELAPTGVNVVGAPDPASDSTPDTRQVRHVSDDTRLAINVNRLEDARVAAALLGDSRGTATGRANAPERETATERGAHRCE